MLPLQGDGLAKKQMTIAGFFPLSLRTTVQGFMVQVKLGFPRSSSFCYLRRLRSGSLQSLSTIQPAHEYLLSASPIRWMHGFRSVTWLDQDSKRDVFGPWCPLASEVCSSSGGRGFGEHKRVRDQRSWDSCEYCPLDAKHLAPNMEINSMKHVRYASESCSPAFLCWLHDMCNSA